MSYIIPIHKPSSVRHALKLKLLKPHEDCIVIAKSNRLEIWVETPTGLEQVSKKRIFGRIAFLEKVKPPLSDTDHLILGTSCGKLMTISYNETSQQLTSELEFSEQHRQGIVPAATTRKCFADPTETHICLSLFEGALSFLRIAGSGKRKSSGLGLDSAYLNRPEVRRISELSVHNITFLHTRKKDAADLAVLHTASQGTLELVVYAAFDGRKYTDFSPKTDRKHKIDIRVGGSNLLIPISPTEDEDYKHKYAAKSSDTRPALGGVIVVGETGVTYVDTNGATAKSQIYALKKPNIFVAWEAIDDVCFLLADEMGGLHLLTVRHDNGEVDDIDVVEIKDVKISVPTAMIYLESGKLFIASHIGNSQVAQLDLHGARGPTLQIVQSMLNIAPICDFTIMDLGNRTGQGQANEFSSGQARIVAGCGAFESGSLQSIRSGVGLEEYGSIGNLGHVRNMFTLKATGSTVDIALIVSLLTETRVFLFDETSDLEEKEAYMSLTLNEETILASSVGDNKKILQVTPSQISLIDAESGMVLSTQTPREGSIYTAASANQVFLLVCEGGNTLVSFSISDALTRLGSKNFGDTDQVACLHVHQKAESDVGIVGLWRSKLLTLYDLRSMNAIQQESLATDDAAAVPRNIVLAQLLEEERSGPTILVAMSDGLVTSFVADPKSFALSDKKSVQLGSQQANLNLIPASDGLSKVFATSEMSSLIRGLDGHIVYSAVTAEEAILAIPFNASSFPDTVVIATNDDVRIAMIESESLTHTKSLPLHQTVRRLAYSESAKLFGLGTILREFADGNEYIQSEFQLVNEISFQEEGKPYQLGYLSNMHELVEAVAVGKLVTVYSEPQERFVVGTSVIGGNSGNNGRILVFGVDERKNPYLIGEYKLKGECKCIGIVDGRIVAALTKTVVVFEYEETSNTTGALKIVASYRTATAPIDIAINDHVIAVTDIMKSVCLIEYIPGEKGADPRLVEIARDMASAWGTAVGHVEDNTWIGADAHLNLKILRQRTDGAIAEDRHALETIGSYHLGENVNRIRSLNVTASKSAIVAPKVFLATTEGSIFMLGSISAHQQTTLTTLQEKIVQKSGTLGSLSWKGWRAPKSSHRMPSGEEAKEPYRFIDGEIIESFLDMDAQTQADIAEHFMTVDAVRGIVEDLKRLH